MILGDARDVNVRPAVVIKIADGDSHVVAIARQAGFLRYVREGSIMIVVEQAVVVLRGIFFQRWNRGAINQKMSRYPSLS